MSKNKLPFLLLCGESGSGKSTIAQKLEKRYGLKQLRSFTTRPKRYTDEDGHAFIEKYDSIEWLKQQFPHRVAETMFDNEFYFATQEQVDTSDVYVIDSAGIEYFKNHYEGERKYKIVYVHSPCFIRTDRMQRRGDTKEQIEKRRIYDIGAFHDIEKIADRRVDNWNLDIAVNEIWTYLNSFTKGDS